MFYIKLTGHFYKLAIKEIIMQYLEGKNIKFINTLEELSSSNDNIIINGLRKEKNSYLFYTIIKTNGQEISRDEIILPIPHFNNNKEKEKWMKRKLKTTILHAMEKGFERSLPWGTLTGIRPSKIVHGLMDNGTSRDDIFHLLKSQYLLSSEKASLLIEVSKNERDILYPIDKNKVSIYIGIPFCPSRCVYCSFVSNVLGKERNLLRRYLKALYYEITQIGKYIQSKHLSVESIYIGGGTPTVLSADELNELFNIVESQFNTKDIKEYTLEAGRPDTINREKLLVAYRHGVNRISINPQTMNEKTLKDIGRLHTSQDIIDSYFLAQEVGFSYINMDLIVGLPGEGVEDIKKTLNQISNLEPENITVHTMAIKKGSKLKENIDEIKLTQEEITKEMLKITEDFAKSNHYFPYYLYRQKYMMGNLENVGYAKPGYKSVYNIQMMGEKQTIIAVGAGSTTKVVFLEDNRIERIPNVKGINEYIQRVQEMVDKKITVLNTLYN